MRIDFSFFHTDFLISDISPITYSPAFQLLIDSGSRGYWLNELAMVIHSDVEASLRLQCTDLLLTALDNCRDVIQVTDSQDRVIYENNR